MMSFFFSSYLRKTNKCNKIHILHCSEASVLKKTQTVANDGKHLDKHVVHI